LIGKYVELLEKHGDIRAELHDRFQHLLIDEYQDTNRAQYVLVKLLAGTHGNIVAVGDEDQSIYRFRGADINNILNFERDFPGARVIKLEQNYRSTGNILDAATGVVSNNVARKGKKLFTDAGSGEPVRIVTCGNEREEAQFVISKIAGATKRPESCVNMHFFYPVLVMDLVEVVRGPQTSDQTVVRAMSMAHQMGRTPVLINKEIDGFIVNRILHAATQEAYRLLDAGVASFEDIDTAVEKGLNWPMGPFRLGDFSGLDVTYNARLHMYRTTGDERFRPSPQLEAKVKAGKLGRKTGEGWYRY